MSTTFITWINFMYIKLGSIPIWPTMQRVAKCMPKSMRIKFPYVKVIIDRVEFRVESASSLFLHKLFYSDYKSHTTVKCLVGICPGEGFSFISQKCFLNMNSFCFHYRYMETVDKCKIQQLE